MSIPYSKLTERQKAMIVPQAHRVVVPEASSYTITLAIPDKRLNPNHNTASKGGRMAKAHCTKVYRAHAASVTLIVTGGTHPKWESATTLVRWYAKHNRRRDKDNAASSLKAAFDGIADAGLIANDSGLTHLPLEIYHDAANPRVEITITKD